MDAVAEDSGDYSLERCWWCGAPFPPHGRKLYCSKYCRQAAWYVLNPDGLKNSSLRFRQRNPDRARELSRNAYLRHAEQRKLAAARWAVANPARRAAISQRRRAAELGSGGDIDPAAWAAKVAAAQGRCAYCATVAPLTMDHRIPLSRGGRHELDNVVPCCKRCNSRKHTRTEDEFRELMRQERNRGPSEDAGSTPARR